jgi:hypothetical protein
MIGSDLDRAAPSELAMKLMPDPIGVARDGKLLDPLPDPILQVP